MGRSTELPRAPRTRASRSNRMAISRENRERAYTTFSERNVELERLRERITDNIETRRAQVEALRERLARYERYITRGYENVSLIDRRMTINRKHMAVLQAFEEDRMVFQPSRNAVMVYEQPEPELVRRGSRRISEMYVQSTLRYSELPQMINLNRNNLNMAEQEGSVDNTDMNIEDFEMVTEIMASRDMDDGARMETLNVVEEGSGNLDITHEITVNISDDEELHREYIILSDTEEGSVERRNRRSMARGRRTRPWSNLASLSPNSRQNEEARLNLLAESDSDDDEIIRDRSRSPILRGQERRSRRVRGGSRINLRSATNEELREIVGNEEQHAERPIRRTFLQATVVRFEDLTVQEQHELSSRVNEDENQGFDVTQEDRDRFLRMLERGELTAEMLTDVQKPPLTDEEREKLDRTIEGRMVHVGVHTCDICAETTDQYTVKFWKCDCTGRVCKHCVTNIVQTSWTPSCPFCRCTEESENFVTIE